MANHPDLPTFADGTAFVEDLEMLRDAIRSITPIPGGSVTPRRTPHGTYFMGGAGGGLIPIVVPASIDGAEFTTSGLDPAIGSCYRVLGTADGWVYSTKSEQLENWYPDGIVGPGFGYAQQGPGTALCLITFSCAKIPAINPSPAPTQGGTGTGTDTGVSKPAPPPLPTGPNGPVNTFASRTGTGLGLSSGGGLSLVPIGPPPPP